MAIYIYVTATGALYSYCPNDTDPVADAKTLTANGLTAVSGLPPLSPTIAWNAATQATMTVVPPVAVPPPAVSGSITVNGIAYQITLGTTASAMQAVL